MRISARLIYPELALVCMEPSLIERFLGYREEEIFVARFPDINGGFVWLRDSPPNRPVSAAVLREIERAERAAIWEPIWRAMPDSRSD